MAVFEIHDGRLSVKIEYILECLILGKGPDKIMDHILHLCQENNTPVVRTLLEKLHRKLDFIGTYENVHDIIYESMYELGEIVEVELTKAIYLCGEIEDDLDAAFQNGYVNTISKRINEEDNYKDISLLFYNCGQVAAITVILIFSNLENGLPLKFEQLYDAFRCGLEREDWYEEADEDLTGTAPDNDDKRNICPLRMVPDDLFAGMNFDNELQSLSEMDLNRTRIL